MPPSVLWFGSKVSTGVGQVRLKHREVFFGSDVKKASIETVEQAFSTVHRTIGWLAHPNSTKVKDALALYFLLPGGVGGHGEVQAIRATLELVQNGMNNGNLSLKTDNSSSKRLQGFGIAAGDTQYIEGYVRGVGTTGVGDIHVKRDYITNNRRQAVRTFIHEATHRFANTKDFGESGYMEADGSAFRAAGLTKDQAIVNADSYAYFCMSLG